MVLTLRNFKINLLNILMKLLNNFVINIINTFDIKFINI
jgi:hypothetical protein